MESLLQHYELPHEARQTHLRPQDTVPGLAKLPSTGHSSCCTVSNPLLAFSYFLKGSDAFFTSYPLFCRFSWIICGGMADGATRKDDCCGFFTPPHTWETDKYHLLARWIFPTRRSCFSSRVMQQNSNISNQPAPPALPWTDTRRRSPCFGAHPAGLAAGEGVPETPGANLCLSDLCCNAKHHPETAGFIQFPDLTGLGQV